MRDRIVPAESETSSADAPRRSAPRLTIRQIGPEDLDLVVAFLVRGFPERDAGYWRRGFARHAGHALPAEAPRFGFVMTEGARIVGVLLTLYAPPDPENEAKPRCNLSSWYVEPAFRPFAILLDRAAMRCRDATFTNISPAPHTIPMHEARGFTRLGRGQFFAVPSLARRAEGMTIEAASRPGALDGLLPAERRLVTDHAAYGCLCLVGRGMDGEAVPFVLLRHPVRWLYWRLGFSPLHYLQLVYCRSTADVARFARPLGLHLLRHHGAACIALDADGAIPGLTGCFIEGLDVRLKRGSQAIGLGDLSYSEMVIFGA